MKHTLAVLWIALASTVAWGQGEPRVDEQAINQARASIEAERLQQTAVFAAEDDACLSRFEVTACQTSVARRRRAVMARLKHQEVELNRALRRQRARDQLESIQKKRDEDAAHRAETSALPPPEDRQKLQDEKVLQHPKPASASDAPAARVKTPEPVDAQAAEERRKSFEGKQQELVRKREERNKRLREAGPAKTTLPVPP